jgi:hypothetical protein
MYSNYSFCLEWDELPEELREEKIDTYIEKNGGTGADLASSDKRQEAENSISAHFPMYF